MTEIIAVDNTGVEVSIGETGAGTDVEVSADKFAELLKLDEILRELKAMRSKLNG